MDRVVHTEAPSVNLRFVPITVDDSVPLREGSADLSIGIYGELPPEVRAREIASDIHPDARTRLDPTDPTSGVSRKRPPRKRN
jgi:hypothetical protein